MVYVFVGVSVDGFIACAENGGPLACGGLGRTRPRTTCKTSEASTPMRLRIFLALAALCLSPLLLCAKSRMYCYQKLGKDGGFVGTGGGVVHTNGFTIEVKPSSDRDLASCHATIMSPKGETVFKLDEWGIDVDPVTGKDINESGYPDAVLTSFSGGAHCCSKYYFISLGSKPGLVRAIDGARDVTFKDLNRDGRTEILLRDGSFDEHFGIGHPYSPFPLLIVLLRGDKFEDVGSQFWGEFEKEILALRRGLKAQNLKNFLASNPSDIHDAQDYLETESAIIKIVLDYLYAGQPDRARTVLAELWPLEHQDRAWDEIVRGYCNGLHAQLGLPTNTTCRRGVSRPDGKR